MQLYKGTRRRSATKQIIGRQIASERETETESEEKCRRKRKIERERDGEKKCTSTVGRVFV